MTTLADTQPILTRRTVNLLGESLPAQVATHLHEFLEDVLDGMFGWFLRGSQRATESEFHLAVARYHRPRMRVMKVLLEAVAEEKFGEIFHSVAQLSQEIIEENAWRLSDDTGALKDAFRFYDAVVTEAAGLITNPSMAVREPFNFLIRSSRMDFCLSAVLAHLEGEITGDVDAERVGYLCRKARETTRDVLEAIQSIRLAEDPEAFRAWRDARLETLCGAWGDEPGMEDDLARIYKSRIDLQ